MSETDKVFAGSIPENYDRYLVPSIFESFAQDIAQRVAALSPSTVLETAAGSGVVSRALTPRLSPEWVPNRCGSSPMPAIHSDRSRAYCRVAIRCPRREVNRNSPGFLPAAS